MISKVLIALIRLYQRTLSPDHGIFKSLYPGGFCKYQPTCSQYCIDSLEKYGTKGIWKGVWRVLRCNPWSKGGYDPA